LDNQTLILIAGGVIFAIILIAAVVTSKPAAERTPTTLPYQKVPYLLSKGERAFFFALCKAVGFRFHIFPKVRLIDIVAVIPGTPNPQSHKNRILSKHVDFVLCARDTFTPLLVIELDDRSHRSPSTQVRDTLKDNILDAAGLPILRIPAFNTYSSRVTQGILGARR
jgi:hypothetical protein